MTMPESTYTLVIDGYQDRTIFPVASEWEVLTKMKISDPARFTMTVGTWVRPLPSLEIAFAAQVVPIHIHATGSIDVTPQPAIDGECASYPPDPDDPCQQSLIYGKEFTLSDNSVALSFTLPVKVSGGVRYIHWHEGKALFDLEVDVHWEGWSSIDQFDVDFGEGAEIDVEINPVTGEHQIASLQDISLKKNWKDTWSVRIGGDVMVVPDVLWLRVGGFFETGAISKAYSALDFLSFDRWGLSGGFTVVPYPGVELSAGYMHIFQEDRNLAEDESEVYQQRPANYCDADTGYATGPDGHPNCDTRSYYNGMPGAPVGGGAYRSSFDILSLGLSIHWEKLLQGNDAPSAQLDRDSISAWTP